MHHALNGQILWLYFALPTKKFDTIYMLLREAEVVQIMFAVVIVRTTYVQFNYLRCSIWVVKTNVIHFKFFIILFLTENLKQFFYTEVQILTKETG